MVNKADVAAEVAERLNGADPDARQYVDAVFDVIMGHVAAGERVQILGFGTFDSVERAARVGRNPRTGAAIQVPASVSPRFHAGQTFRTQVSDGAPAAATPAVKAAPAAPAVEAEAEQDTAKPAEAKKAGAEKAGAKKAKAADKKPAKAVAEKPAETVAVKPVKSEKKKTAKAADEKAAKPAPKKSAKSLPAKSLKDAKKTAKAGKAGKK